MAGKEGEKDQFTTLMHLTQGPPGGTCTTTSCGCDLLHGPN